MATTSNFVDSLKELTVSKAVQLIVILLLAFGSVMFYVRDTPSERASVERLSIEHLNMKEKTKQVEAEAKAGRASARALESIVAPQQQAAAVPVAAPVDMKYKEVEMIPCSTNAEKEMISLVDANTRTISDTGTQYRFGQGCAWVKLEGDAVDLAGSNYWFEKRLDEATRRVCGVTGKYHHTGQECIQYLKEYGPALLVIGNGGSVVIATKL